VGFIPGALIPGVLIPGALIPRGIDFKKYWFHGITRGFILKRFIPWGIPMGLMPLV